MLDQFQAWLSERRIQPSLTEWSANRDYIESGLKRKYTTSRWVWIRATRWKRDLIPVQKPSKRSPKPAGQNTERYWSQAIIRL